MKLTKTMFLTALAMGGLLTCSPLRAQDTPANPAGGPSTNAPAHTMPRGNAIDRIAQMLNLTDDQKPQVETILTSQRQKMMAIRQDDTLSMDDKRAKAKALRDDTNAQMKNVLTADQYQKWLSMQTHMRRMAPPQPGAGGASSGEGAPPAAPTTPATPAPPTPPTQ
jgi:Spy/CpxP family protein refolding chaperone